MNTLPDYSLLHTHELRSRLKALDPKNDQEEIQEIQRWIDKGGYQYPEVSPGTQSNVGHSIRRKAILTKFHNTMFILVLFAVLTLLLLWNIYALIFLRSTFSLIPVIFQSIIVYCLYKAHPMSQFLVKTWAGLLMVSGFFGLIEVVLRGSFPLEKILINVLFLSGGIYVWMKTSQSMEVVYAEPDAPD